MAYPRKQTLIVFVICVIAVIGFAIYVYQPSFQPGNSISYGAIGASGDTDASDLPTAATWRSQFLVASSSKNAFNTSSATNNAATETTDNRPLTATDLLGQEFFSNYMQLHQAGLDTDQNAVSDMSNQLVDDGAQFIQPPTTYDLSSLHVSNVTTPAALSAYGNSIVAILSAYIPDQDHNEAVIAENALDQGDMSMLDQLDPIIANYKKALATLLSMNVPKPLEDYHLDLTNGVAIELYNAESLKNVASDPLTSLGAVSLEETALQSMDEGVTGIRQYYSTIGIPFNG